MSKQILQMKYHPAKKEVYFMRIVSGKEVPIKNDSKLYSYMAKRGKFVLQDHGNKFFEDIAEAFDGEKSVHLDVVTTKTDYEDVLQMVEYYNSNSSVEITTTLLSELPDMEETYSVVRNHGKKSISVLEKHKKQFFDVPLGNESVKKCVKMFSDDVQKEIDSIYTKIDSMANNCVELCFAGVYSSGKSALINAILGEKILPEADSSKTACMVKIQSPDNEHNSIRLHFHIHKGFVEIIWNEKSEIFEIVTELSENSTRRNLQECINSNAGKPLHHQLYNLLDKLNDFVGDQVMASERVSNNITLYFPIPLDNDSVKFVIYDTPGTDSNFGEHQSVLQDALSEQTHSILIFVATPTKLEGAGNNALLSYLTEAEKKDSKTSIDIARSLFVINHADDSKEEQLKLVATKKITHKDDESVSIPLFNKKLFFTSASYAYAAKAIINKIASDDEKEIVDSDYSRITKPTRGQYYKLNRVATSERLSEMLISRSEKEFTSADKNNEKERAFYICSGLYALETEITNYGEKYASAVRAFAIIDSVDKALSTMNKNAKSLERQNQEDINRINKEINELENTINSSIGNAYIKYEYPKNTALPQEMLNSLKLDSVSLVSFINDRALTFIEKLLKGWFFGLGKVKFNDKHKKEITQRITLILNDFTKDFLTKRQQKLENIRDNFIADVKKAIQENGNLSDKAKNFTQSIRPPEIKKPTNLIEFGDMYDNNKRADRFLWMDTQHIDKDGFIQDADRKLTEIATSMATDFEKDFRATLTSILSAIEKEFTQNIKKYSLNMQAMFEDKEAMEQLRKKIDVAAQDLISCQEELNKVIWSVK